MPKYRDHLPQLDGKLFLTDGGLETTLVFHENIDLPYFAAFDLLRTKSGTATLRHYFEPYIRVARDGKTGLVLEAATWRASRDWGEKLGYSPDALAAVNRDAIALLADIRAKHETPETPMVISGCLGPRGDGYDPGEVMSPEAAQSYHAEQIDTFRDTEADVITALTLTNINEAIGITRAAKAAGMPVVISFTVETDGRLPTGDRLKEAIEAVDSATASGPAHYMINCAHPDHFTDALAEPGPWQQRLKGLRANASRMSHAELDAAEDLDDGDPAELGRLFGNIRHDHPQINVLGGCCGTDHRHIGEICQHTAAAA